MKRTAIIVLMLMLSMVMTGCIEEKTVVRTETGVLVGTIESVEYVPASHRHMVVGKVLTTRRVAEEYNTTINFEELDYRYTFNSKSVYEQCEDNIGATVHCQYITEYYEDGSKDSHISGFAGIYN